MNLIWINVYYVLAKKNEKKHSQMIVLVWVLTNSKDWSKKLRTKDSVCIKFKVIN